MVVTEAPVEYEVLLVVVALGSPYRSCWLQLFLLLVIVPAGYCSVFEVKCNHSNDDHFNVKLSGIEQQHSFLCRMNFLE